MGKLDKLGTVRSMEGFDSTKCDTGIALSKKVWSTWNDLIILIRKNLNMRIDLVKFLKLEVKPFLEKDCSAGKSAIAAFVRANPGFTKDGVTEDREAAMPWKGALTVGDIHSIRECLLTNRVRTHLGINAG
jgi:hypothetical protein